MIDQTEVQSAIASGVTVTKAEIASARAYILKHFDPQPRTMLTQLLADFEAAPPRRLILDDSVPVEPQVKQSIAWITWQLSFGEALWTLVNSGALLISSRDLDELQAHLEWTTGVFNYQSLHPSSTTGSLFDHHLAYFSFDKNIQLGDLIDAGQQTSIKEIELDVLATPTNGLGTEHSVRSPLGLACENRTTEMLTRKTLDHLGRRRCGHAPSKHVARIAVD